ncbi:MAG: rhodanese-like domain-containing protein [Ignavibacteriota bacterium]|jgi:rhodanese-related sulfurtransferase|nr:MAG: rhodanese-like domain-containing protein [Chlorobiota bacterium]MBE7475857.1 rhodanese-like domain-containing protein [Ignavibacteriales bacterium]MBL1123335.1 rhodanese-like domain-containing protein [Ignavibacteriota bacterium]MCC7092978.1 rhodanese-like domain-containing protein [Ignavibacteriaceae bacterium]MCE7856536.1 rhodanese-like domain-containing protein [Ignavibacteria bacterium CHB3]
MSTEQIFLYTLIALIAFYIIRKILLIKTIKQYSAQEASQKVKKERNVILLDVRTETERKKNSIRGSYHIPLSSISANEGELKKFKASEIICYCQTGNRSLNAASKLRKLGFNASNLRGGILRWNAAGLK